MVALLYFHLFFRLERQQNFDLELKVIMNERQCYLQHQKNFNYYFIVKIMFLREKGCLFYNFVLTKTKSLLKI